MPSFPVKLLENDKQFQNSILLSLKATIAPVAVDYRDQWPTDPSDSIVRGDFGAVKVAECRDPIFGFVGNEARRCVVKTIYFRRRIEVLLAEKAYQKDDSIVSVDEKLYRFWRRTIMDIYVLTRCRHENLLHAHCLFVYDDDLHIITPRLYVLRELIDAYRVRHNAEPCPTAIIARILRQLCAGLDYLNRAGIVHRDVQPDNIFMTRNGTVKLGHFGQSRSIAENPTCITPVGKFEFMAFEKQHNFSVQNKNDCLSYSASADIWSLGILVLQMITYYPNEPYQKLPRNFAALMHEEKMPFTWLLASMMQLRSRLVKSGGDELKVFLSEMLLTVEDSKRPTPAQILKSPYLKRWCSPTVEEDKKYLKKTFINDIDFANQSKLDIDGPNYDALESKNIPAEFYWDDSWKILEDQNFTLTVKVERNTIKANFRWGDPAPLFRVLTKGITAGFLELADFLIVEPEIDKLAFDIIREMNKGGKKARSRIQKETKINLESGFGKRGPREMNIVMEVAGKKKLNSLGWSTDSEEE